MQDSFNPKSLTINKLFTDADSLYQIPKYQRPYKWTDDQIDKLWDDLWESYTNQEANYFLGSVITAKPVKGGPYLDIVDGQQRMTTLIILFAVVRDIYPKINEVLCESDPSAIGETHLKSAILHNDKFGRLRLHTHSNHQSDFDNIIVKGDISSLKKPYKKDLRKDEEPKYKFINTACFLKEHFQSIGEEETGKFINYIFNKVKIIRIDCTDVGFAIKLFQVLNARGLDLTNADLIKSYLLNRIHQDYGKDIVETKENQFLQDWINCEKIASETNESLNSLLVIYEYYLLAANPKKSLYDELVNQFSQDDPLDIIRDFNMFCEIYKEKIYKSNDEIIYSYFYLGWSFYWRTTLLTALHTGYNQYDELKFVLRKYYYCHWISGYTLNRVKQPTFNFIKWIKEKKPINEIKEEIHKLFTDLNIQSKLEESLNGQVYHERWLKPLLFMVEYNQTDNPKKLSISDTNIHIEHILPQNFSKIYGWKHVIEDERDGKEYVHKLGNLTLLSGRKNIQASDDEFDKKVQIYKGKGKHNNLDEKITSFRITQQIVDMKNSGDLDKWSIDTINDRKLSLLNEIEKILNVDLNKIK